MPTTRPAKTHLLAAAAIAATLLTGAPIVMSSPAEAARCGGLNQKPCSVLSGRRPCAKGLIHIPFVKCAKKPKIKKPKVTLPNPFKGDLKAKARRAMRDSKHVIRIIASMHRCIHGRHEDAIHLARLLKRKRRFNIKRMPVYRNCISRPMRNLRSLGYQSVQLGVAGNAGVVLDGSHEQGIVFSTSGRGRPYHYQTWGYGFGPTAGASVNISVTANRAAPNRVGGRMPKGSPGHGYVVAGYGAYGGGVGLWFDYNDRQTAISAFGGAGLQGKGFVYTRNTTFQKRS